MQTLLKADPLNTLGSISAQAQVLDIIEGYCLAKYFADNAGEMSYDISTYVCMYVLSSVIMYRM
jgi:hypothetical protein